MNEKNEPARKKARALCRTNLSVCMPCPFRSHMFSSFAEVSPWSAVTWVNSICSGETVLMCKLAWTVAVHIYYNGSFPGSWYLTLSVPNFRRHLSSAFLLYRLKRSLYVKLKNLMSSSVDPDETAHRSHLISIYAVCKSLLLSPVAVKELV